MKKITLLVAFGIAGLVSAKSPEIKKVEEQMGNVKAFTCYLITLKTICGTTYQTILDTDFDTYDCVNNEWEMYNEQDCGHASYENPPV
ncbi:hypothetical protein HNP24_000049 [Chryseobacterium sediminis]|uniref:Uncharacterized protein n=1 Tax=Chryseobacterium sediminis TaxID=1679494 RepID=A0ABR6PTS1_9FLAO|nr:hypothetical protein [Chryseobacterium sediminis]MBB6329099.1 hypothetical protein [Chryseobacterium sediminis]